MDDVRHDVTIAEIEALNPYGITPHGDRYIVRKLTVDPTVRVATSAGERLIRIEGTKNFEDQPGYYLAEVVAVGSGHRLETDTFVPMPFGPGETVMVEQLSGRELRLGRHSYTIVNQVDILAAIPELDGPEAEPIE
jgi:co-chaperonin GroES (HSP10)